MPKTMVRLFGSPTIERDGQRVEVDTRKAIALLAYLALSRRPVGRTTLATLLWPEYDVTRSAANLRRTLWSLHAALGKGMPVAGPDSVTLADHPDVQVDVLEFQHLLAKVSGHHPSDHAWAGDRCASCQADLEAAAALVRGDFLEGFTLRDTVEFDDWQSLTTAGLRRELGIVLRQLVSAHVAAGQMAAASAAADRWVQLDPLDQESVAQLMRCYAWTGQHAAALHAYRQLERRLQDELGISPTAEITDLFAAIKARREPPPPAGRESPLEQAQGTGSAQRSESGGPPLRREDPEAQRPVFVARDGERAALDHHLQAALAGNGRVVFVVGEAGQGKTALLHAFVRQACAKHPELVAALGSGNAYTGLGDPYLPFRELFELLCGAVDASTAGRSLDQEQVQRLWRTMPRTAQQIVEHGPDLLDTFVPLRPLLARCRSAADEDLIVALARRAEQPPQFDPMLQQASLFEQFTRVLAGLASSVPLLLVLDDLQWSDAGSLALLFHVSRRLRDARVLIVGAYRPSDVALGRLGERHPLAAIVHEIEQVQGASQIDLTQRDGPAFVAALLDSEPNRLDAAFRRELVRQTDGHPLFTVELLRGMQERGDLVRDATGSWVAQASLSWARLPARIEAVIAERIGRLPTALRTLLRAASIEGEEFSAEVAAQIVGMDEGEARRRLSSELDREHRLVRALGVERVNGRRLTRYRFHHYLIQRALVSSLDAAERAAYSEDAALLLETIYAGRTEERAVALACHFETAGIAARAIYYFQQAGDRALRLSASAEAADLYGRALALLTDQPPTPERLQQEFDLQARYSVPLQHLEGWASERVEAAFARALTLARQMGNPPSTHPLLGRIAHAWVYRGELQRALTLAQELLELANAEEDDAVLVEAHTVVGLTQFYLGHFLQAQPHLDRALALFDPIAHAHLTFLYGQDAGVHAGLYRMLNLTLLGYMDQARAQAAATLARAEAIDHPFTRAFAWNFVSLAAGLALDIDQLDATSRTALTVAFEHAFPTWLAFGLIANGYAQACCGNAAAGLADALRGLALARPTGAQTTIPFVFGLVAEMHCRLGQFDEGLALLDSALLLSAHNQEGMSLADLHRRRAEVLLALGHAWPEVDSELRAAVAIARRQQARLHELRALTTRLCLSRASAPDQIEEARAELASATAWFEEGVTAPDLAAAKAELAR